MSHCLLFTACLGAYSPLYAESDPMQNMCGRYIKEISTHLKVIPEIIWAVTGTESNYRGAPWPWSANLQGKSYYFKSEKALKDFINSLSSNEKENLDVGCMQLNYRYHGWKFKDVQEMTDPQRNMVLGTMYLYELYLREKIHQLSIKQKNPKKKMLNDLHIWAIAVGRYHSHRQNHGKKYVKAVTKHLAPQPSLHTPGTIYDGDILAKDSELDDLEKKYKHLLENQRLDQRNYIAQNKTSLTPKAHSKKHKKIKNKAD